MEQSRSQMALSGGHWWEARVSIIAEVFVTEERSASEPTSDIRAMRILLLALAASAVLLPPRNFRRRRFPTARSRPSSICPMLRTATTVEPYSTGRDRSPALRGRSRVFRPVVDKSTRRFTTHYGTGRGFLTGDTASGIRRRRSVGTFVRIASASSASRRIARMRGSGRTTSSIRALEVPPAKDRIGLSTS